MYATASPCRPSTTSYAWIDPHGKLHKLPSGVWHNEWAEDFVEGVPSLQDKLWDEAGGDHMDLLLAEGWIRMTNATAIQAWDTHRPSQKAWDATIDILIECSLKDRRFDPERTMIYFETSRSEDRMPVAEFVARFGGRKAEDRLFDGLMKRLARRIAKAWVRRS